MLLPSLSSELDGLDGREVLVHVECDVTAIFTVDVKAVEDDLVLAIVEAANLEAGLDQLVKLSDGWFLAG